MSISIFKHTLQTKLAWFVAIAGALLLFGLAQLVHAQAPTVLLQVCSDTQGCGADISVQTGDDITLNWYIDGDLNNCNLFVGSTVLQSIDTSSLPGTPINGSLDYQLPEGETDFSLTCDGYSDGVSVQVPPIIEMSIDGGNTRTLNDETGNVGTILVRWNSSFADSCGLLEYEFADDPGNIRVTNTSNSNDYFQPYFPDGWAEFDGSPMPNPRVDTTFYITCYNSVTGAETTESISLTVTDPPPPDPVEVSISADSYGVVTNDFTGYANVGVYTRSENVSFCAYRSYAADGVTSVPNPPGYGQWGGHEDGDFTVRLATTTVLEFECWRNEITYGGVTYPYEASSTRITINVINDPDIDRLLIAPATVTLTPVPPGATSTELDPLYAEGSMTFEIYAENVEYCYLRAYTSQSRPSIGEVTNDPREDDTEESDLEQWTREHSWERLSADGNRIVDRTITTNKQKVPRNYSVECWRDYDMDNFAPGTPEWNNGYAYDTHWIDTYTAAAAAAPVVDLYAGGFAAHADYIFDNALSITNYSIQNDDSGRMLYMPSRSNPASITFPYDGVDGDFDVYVSLCDESDGDSEFTFTSSGVAGVIGTIFNNNPNSWDDDCNDLTLYTTLLASDVAMANGDSVTVDCQNIVSDGEACRFHHVSFIPANFSGSYEVIPDPNTGFAEVPLVWLSENTTWCWAQPAIRGDGSTFNWSTQWQTTATEVQFIGTSTAYSVECYRDADSQVAVSDVQLIFPGSQQFSAAAAAAAGDCIDPANPTAGYQTAPNGMMPNTSVPLGDPTYGLCIWAADLGMLSPSPSELSVDPVAGTYDIRALTAITNHGPGPLSDTTSIAYFVSTELSPSASYYAAYVSRYGDASDETSPIPRFEDGITEPVDYANPTEENISNVVFNGVPFGTHDLCNRVNIASDYASPSDALTEPDLNPVDGLQDLANNTPTCTTYTLPVPEPPMNLIADPLIVRGGQGAELQWDINVTYQMDCSLNGPGGANNIPGFNTIDVGAGHSDSTTVGPLSATSEFVFSCTEDLTNTTFTETVIVEVVPDFEEI